MVNIKQRINKIEDQVGVDQEPKRFQLGDGTIIEFPPGACTLVEALALAQAASKQNPAKEGKPHGCENPN